MMTQPAKTEREVRSLVLPVETRSAGEQMTVAGYAAIFGDVTVVADLFEETIQRGAFTRSVRADDVRAFFGHDSRSVLGRKQAGTLRLAEDAKGLAVEIDLPDTTLGRDVRTLIERGDISGMSFGFQCVAEEWDFSRPMARRTITDLDLYEVSIVSVPAYAGTSIALRSLEHARGSSEIRCFIPARQLRMKMRQDLALRR